MRLIGSQLFLNLPKLRMVIQFEISCSYQFHIIFWHVLTHHYKNAPTDIDGVSLAHTIHNPKMSDKEQKIRDRLIIGVFHHFQRTGLIDNAYQITAYTGSRLY